MAKRRKASPSSTALGGASPTVNLTEMAARLGVSKATLSRWARDGKVPHFRVERTVRFNPDAVWASIACDKKA